MTFPVLLCFLLTTTGCWDQKPVEEMGLVAQLGIESTADNKLLFTHTVPLHDRAAKDRDELFSVKANLIQESRQLGSFFASGGIEYGKVQQIFFSTELAEKGIQNLLEVFERDPEKPLHPFLVVVEGSPAELLENIVNQPDKPHAFLYLNSLLRNNIGMSYIPGVRITDFDIAYITPGIDPIVPLIKLEPEGIKITGTVLFSEDKMAGRIDLQQTALLLGMMGKLRRTELIFKSAKLSGKEENSKTGVAVSVIKSRRKIKIKMKDNQPVIQISLRLWANLSEYRWDHIDDEEIQTEMERELSRELKKACVKVIEDTQKAGSDPIGIGELIRAKHNSYWKKINWIETYRDLKIKIDVKLDLNQHGMIH